MHRRLLLLLHVRELPSTVCNESETGDAGGTRCDTTLRLLMQAAVCARALPGAAGSARWRSRHRTLSLSQPQPPRAASPAGL